MCEGEINGGEKWFGGVLNDQLYSRSFATCLKRINPWVMKLHMQQNFDGIIPIIYNQTRMYSILMDIQLKIKLSFSSVTHDSKHDSKHCDVLLEVTKTLTYMWGNGSSAICSFCWMKVLPSIVKVPEWGGSRHLIGHMTPNEILEVWTGKGICKSC